MLHVFSYKYKHQIKCTILYIRQNWLMSPDGYCELLICTQDSMYKEHCLFTLELRRLVLPMNSKHYTNIWYTQIISKLCTYCTIYVSYHVSMKPNLIAKFILIALIFCQSCLLKQTTACPKSFSYIMNLTYVHFGLKFT